MDLSSGFDLHRQRAVERHHLKSSVGPKRLDAATLLNRDSLSNFENFLTPRTIATNIAGFIRRNSTTQRHRNKGKLTDQKGDHQNPTELFEPLIDWGWNGGGLLAHDFR